MAIIDHDEMMAERAADRTMPLRVVTADEAREGLAVLQNGVTGEMTVAVDPGFREDIARSQVLEYRPPSERPETFHQSRRRFQWAGPFPVRRAESMSGRLSISKPPLGKFPTRKELAAEAERFAKEAPIEDVVEAVVALSTEEGVEQESDDDTSTFALPAVWKMTGKASTNKLAHRSAAHVQQIFNEAGWPIAVWYGEATGEYWVMDEDGLHSFETITAMYQGMGWEAL